MISLLSLTSASELQIVQTRMHATGDSGRDEGRTWSTVSITMPVHLLLSTGATAPRKLSA